MATLTALWLTTALGISTQALAEEQISRFHSEIDVLEDGRLEVTEHIDVIAEGKQFKRGIYRDLKLTFDDLEGTAHTAGYEVREVTRNGLPENWFTERNSDVLRVYVGKKSVSLVPGEYRYTIRYITDYQLGFGQYHDSLYWNVTGNDWAFRIGSASAEIRLPGDANDVQFTAFTGLSGSKNKDAYVSQSSNVLRAESLSALGPGEGLTIYAKWPVGTIDRPEGVTRFRKLPGVTGVFHSLGKFLGNGIATLVALALTLTGIGWFWGRRPAIERSAGIRRTPLDRLGPAATRWVDRGSFDAETLKAALVSLAAKGRLTINEEETERFFGTATTMSVEKIDTAHGPALTGAETAVLNAMFASGRTRVPISKSHYSTWARVSDQLVEKLEADYASEFFDRNTDLMFKAGVIAVAMFGLWMLVRPDNAMPWVWVAIASLVLLLLFCFCINSTTGAGLQAQHEIDRFRKYLKGEYPNAPPVDAKEWEQLLPYAIALGVTQEWTDRAGSGTTQPRWYSGARFASLGIAEALAEFDDDLGSSVARSSRPKASEISAGGVGASGFSGGSSGGGGGGGGGGGW